MRLKCFCGFESGGAPVRIRTGGLQIRSLTLYPAELRARDDSNEKAGVRDGGRTRDIRNHNPTLYRLSYSHLTRSDRGG